jgi:hypothetical protein
MMLMTSSPSDMSALVSRLENHPRARELLPLVNEFLNSSHFSETSSITRQLLEICSTDPELFIELGIMRGLILQEEGYASKALVQFWEAIQFQATALFPWNQIISHFLKNNDLITANFFLIHAKKIFPTETIFQLLVDQISELLVQNLSLAPGFPSNEPDSVYEIDTAPQIPSPEVNNSLRNEGLPHESENSFSSSIQNLWEMALECYQDIGSENSQKNTQAFIHYVHSTIREILGLQGSFREGLDEAVNRKHLLDYKQFYLDLNRLRNAVIHDNYLPSSSEVQEIYTQITSLLHSIDYTTFR